ncbi:uncharacterized protein LOC132904207 [Amyelois transitella]|uniref:uncharacterized protein LOC132904207 n=1 Tax=Amyelois transitella TaxID=680683 RepID=UPI00298F92CD|nr:uncharacterized protein LOC132904207 [Amyelois transitella]
MKSACTEILEAADKIADRGEESEVNRKMAADNKRMREELVLLRQETKALRIAFSERKAPNTEPLASTPDIMAQVDRSMRSFGESLTRDLFLSLGGMMNDRIKELEKRAIVAPQEVLRPPLAADRRNKEAGKAQDEAPKQPENVGAVAGSTLMPPARPGPAPKAPKATTAKALQAPSQDASGAPPQEEPTPSSSWTEVVKKGKNKGKGKKSSPPGVDSAAPRPTAPAPVKRQYALPKSTAVVVTLKSGATVDYKTVMGRVTTIKLATMGVDHVAVRSTATGARIIEVPGSDSGAVADNLPSKIRELVGEVAEVTRPYKTAQIKISGFDESVTPEILQREVSQVGKCPPEQIKVGQIRMTPDFTGAVIVTCPVAVANALVADGRILIGWSSAKITGLEPLPMRCFRCMGLGHTRALCPSPVDRSELCHRCGKTGHLTQQCAEKEPWCAVCHHAKLPAKHTMGGKACNPPRTRGRLEPTGPNRAGSTMEH